MRSAALKVCLKEILENARDRRTILTTMLFGPLMGPIFFVVVMNVTISQVVTSAESPISVPIIGAEHAGNLVAFLASRNIDPAEGHDLASLDEAMNAVRSGEQELVIYIDESFGDDLVREAGAHVGLIFDDSDTPSGQRVGRVRGAINAYSQQIGSLRLLARGIDPGIGRALIVDSFDVSTPSGRSSVMLGMLTYFLLFATLMGGLYLAIDTTAGERERKSLEPLLSTPVARSSLLLGKLAATIAYMLLSLALTLACFAVVVRYMPLEELGMSSAFGPVAALLAFLVLVPVAPAGAALMTLVASFTKSYKEAQGYRGRRHARSNDAPDLRVDTQCASIATAAFSRVGPGLGGALADAKGRGRKPSMMLVPSLSQHLLVTNLIRQEPIEPTMLAVSVVSTLLLGGALSYVAMRLYDREGLLG